MLGGIGGRRRRGRQRMRWLDGITDSMDVSLADWSQRTRKVYGIIQFNLKGLRTQGNDGVGLIIV